jgi:uncharacterized protein (TIGR00730 family)
MASPSYRIAYEDDEFLHEDRMRPVRLELELMKPELALLGHHIKSTIVVFGSARVNPPAVAKKELAELEAHARKELIAEDLPEALRLAKKRAHYAHYYEEARKLARLVSKRFQSDHQRHYVIVTGGGPGIMEAANRGAHEVNCRSIGFNIQIPHEQEPNPYITPELCFLFHYFALRKMHFLLRARALVAFPGGFGTLDELTDALTLIQTKKIEPMPIILFGTDYWKKLLNIDFLVDEGMIDASDAKIVTYLDTAEEAVEFLAQHYKEDAPLNT